MRLRSIYCEKCGLPVYQDKEGVWTHFNPTAATWLYLLQDIAASLIGALIVGLILGLAVWIGFGR